MHLYHYYEQSIGPLKNLSDLPLQEALKIQEEIKSANLTFAARRFDGYHQRRRELEQIVRSIFISKGGKPIKKSPHYFVVAPCLFLETWYQNPAHINIPVSALDTSAISFTYGDMFPTFSPKVSDGKEYRSNVYTYEEILCIIQKYDLPQNWNPDGKLGPERYIEAHIWADIPDHLYRSEKAR